MKYKNSLWRTIFVTTSLIILAFYLISSPPFPIIPKIARNLPSNFAEAESVFLRRVKNDFPPKTKESVLIHELKEQGFSVNSNTKQAYFLKSGFPCKLKWRIGWISEKGSITKIDASYGGICL